MKAYKATNGTVERVAVNEQENYGDDVARLQAFRASEYVLTLLEAFVTEGTVHLVYEDLRCSLCHIASLPQKLSSRELGAICKDVSRPSRVSHHWQLIFQIIAGLSFIHNQLLIAHGDLHCGNIFLDSNCRLKIGMQPPLP